MKTDYVWEGPDQAAMVEIDDGKLQECLFRQQRRRSTPGYTNCSQTTEASLKNVRLSPMRFTV
jgi:hypothetical protein